MNQVKKHDKSTQAHPSLHQVVRKPYFPLCMRPVRGYRVKLQHQEYMKRCTTENNILYSWSFSWVQIFTKQAKIWASEIFAVNESRTHGSASSTAKS